MTSLDIQKQFNSVYAGYNKRGGINCKKRAVRLYTLYMSMNAARQAEGRDMLILPSLEKRFSEYGIA